MTIYNNKATGECQIMCDYCRKSSVRAIGYEEAHRIAIKLRYRFIERTSLDHHKSKKKAWICPKCISEKLRDYNWAKENEGVTVHGSVISQLDIKE
jgi:hypothetical protein